jgi:hypothetical protein
MRYLILTAVFCVAVFSGISGSRAAELEYVGGVHSAAVNHGSNLRLLVVPGENVKARFVAYCPVTCEVELLKDPVGGAFGEPRPFVPFNQMSGPATTELYNNPGYSHPGIVVFTARHYPSIGGPFSDTGPIFTLDPIHNYMFRVANVSGAQANLTLTITIWESTVTISNAED